MTSAKLLVISLPSLLKEGDGSFAARIENPDDNDWYLLPIRGQGFFDESVGEQQRLIPFMELNRDGTSGGFFETDDRRDGTARVSFLPEAGQNELWVKVSSVDETQGSYNINVWRSDNPDDDFPDGGGVFLQRRPLAEHGQIFINGTTSTTPATRTISTSVRRPAPPFGPSRRGCNSFRSPSALIRSSPVLATPRTQMIARTRLAVAVRAGQLSSYRTFSVVRTIGSSWM